MTIELFKDGNLIKSFTHWPAKCAKVRRHWVWLTRRHPGNFYIVVKDASTSIARRKLINEIKIAR